MADTKNSEKADYLSRIAEKIPWWKLTAPMVGIGFVDIIIIVGMCAIYSRSINDPASDFSINTSFVTFLRANIAIIFSYTFITIVMLWSEIRMKEFEKMKSLFQESKNFES